MYLSKARRYLRLWVRDAIAETLAPLTDSNARLYYIGVVVLIFLLAPRRGIEADISAKITALQGFENFLYSLPVFLLLNLFFGVFRVAKGERQKGEWFGNRFVYHQPVRLLTVLVDELDNEKPIKFKITDAEDDSLVSYIIETDRMDRRVKVELAWPGGKRPMDFGSPRDSSRGSFRLPNERAMSLLCNIEPASTVTTVRVYMTSWELGKGDGRG